MEATNLKYGLPQCLAMALRSFYCLNLTPPLYGVTRYRSLFYNETNRKNPSEGQLPRRGYLLHILKNIKMMKHMVLQSLCLRHYLALLLCALLVGCSHDDAVEDVVTPVPIQISAVIAGGTRTDSGDKTSFKYGDVITIIKSNDNSSYDYEYTVSGWVAVDKELTIDSESTIIQGKFGNEDDSSGDIDYLETEYTHVSISDRKATLTFFHRKAKLVFNFVCLGDEISNYEIKCDYKIYNGDVDENEVGVKYLEPNFQSFDLYVYSGKRYHVSVSDCDFSTGNEYVYTIFVPSFIESQHSYEGDVVLGDGKIARVIMYDLDENKEKVSQKRIENISWYCYERNNQSAMPDEYPDYMMTDEYGSGLPILGVVYKPGLNSCKMIAMNDFCGGEEIYTCYDLINNGSELINERLSEAALNFGTWSFADDQDFMFMRYCDIIGPIFEAFQKNGIQCDKIYGRYATLTYGRIVVVDDEGGISYENNSSDYAKARLVCEFSVSSD
jgi:hypothetical protein